MTEQTVQSKGVRVQCQIEAPETRAVDRALGMWSRRPRGQTFGLVLLAVAALAMGLAVYVLGRAPGSAMAWPEAWSVGLVADTPAAGGAGHWLGVVGGSLPSFVHAFAFAVLSALLLPRTRFWAAGACAAWAVIDTVFEALQHPVLSAPAARWLQDLDLVTALQWCADKTARYLASGSFDPFDVLAGLLGALAAYAVCRATLLVAERPTG